VEKELLLVCMSSYSSILRCTSYCLKLGFWAAVLCVAVLFPIAYWVPGNDHGSYEDPFSTWSMLLSSVDIQIAYVIYIISVIGYVICAVVIILKLGSVWCFMMDNFRPVTGKLVVS